MKILIQNFIIKMINVRKQISENPTHIITNWPGKERERDIEERETILGRNKKLF